MAQSSSAASSQLQTLVPYNVIMQSRLVMSISMEQQAILLGPVSELHPSRNTRIEGAFACIPCEEASTSDANSSHMITIDDVVSQATVHES